VCPALVGKIFGIDAELITLRYSDPEGPELIGAGSFGSRSLLSYGNALATGAREVVAKGAQFAASLLEASSDATM
jgi:carbon-monoxide dehydrogenase large subunit